MPTISVVTVVKNETLNMRDFLATLEGVANELIIVDTGSTDDTIALIQHAHTSYPIRFYEKTFIPFHFGKAKNYALSKASGDYALALAADERLSTPFKKRIKEFLANAQPNIVELPRIDELVPHLKDIQPCLFKNNIGIHWGEDDSSVIHEQLFPPYPPILFEEPFFHFQGGRHWLRKPSRIKQQLAMEVSRTPRTRGRLAELVRAPVKFYYKFHIVYVDREAYKDGWNGFMFALLKGWYDFVLQVRVALKPKQM